MKHVAVACAAFLLTVPLARGATLAAGDLAVLRPYVCPPILCPPPQPVEIRTNGLALKATTNSFGPVAFGSGNRLYVAGAGTGTLDVYDVSLNRTTFPLPPVSNVFGLAIVANGNLLFGAATPSGAWTLYVLSPTGAVLQTFPLGSTAAPNFGIDLAPDQCTVFYTDASGGHRFNVCTGAPLPDLPPGGWVAIRAFADGGYIAAAGPRLYVFDATDRLVRVLTPQVSDIRTLAFDIDPRYLWAGADTALYKIDLVAGTRVAFGDGATQQLAVNGEQRPLFSAIAEPVPTLSATFLGLLAAALVAVALLRLA